MVILTALSKSNCQPYPSQIANLIQHPLPPGMAQRPQQVCGSCTARHSPHPWLSLSPGPRQKLAGTGQVEGVQEERVPASALAAQSPRRRGPLVPHTWVRSHPRLLAQLSPLPFAACGSVAPVYGRWGRRRCPQRSISHWQDGNIQFSVPVIIYWASADQLIIRPLQIKETWIRGTRASGGGRY